MFGKPVHPAGPKPAALFVSIIVAAAALHAGCNTTPPPDQPTEAPPDTQPTERTISLPASADNTLYEDAEGSLSNGAGQHLFAGLTSRELFRRGVLFFDVAGGIPAGAQITSVVLRLSLSRTASDEPREIGLHRLLSAWGEGASAAEGTEGAGAAAATGDATWLHTVFPDGFWAAPGGDFVEMPSATTSVGAVGSYQWGSTSDMVSDVQAWLDEPASNQGWVVIGDEATPGTAARFDSRENTDEAVRPELAVTFAEPS
ncbi:MAG: DNRLRE domain-containing protein [Phycisphaerae bacterium]